MRRVLTPSFVVAIVVCVVLGAVEGVGMNGNGGRAVIENPWWGMLGVGFLAGIVWGPRAMLLSVLTWWARSIAILITYTPHYEDGSGVLIFFVTLVPAIFAIPPGLGALLRFGWERRALLPDPRSTRARTRR